ncbi:DUF4190 domain-containing protein [Agromyces tardus]|uniref:DUF4190 domain-containing protein n=1 Tax=Agromyces tardus TaxID=2583849 RepID=UPI00110C5E78|nr:DUF4190 domain-containing protein [Agromyces tardus]
MSDRAGATPDGVAPVRSPQAVPGPDAAQPGRDAAAEPSAAVGGPGAGPGAAVGEPAASASASASAARRDLEYEVPFDTGQLQALPTGQLLTVHRPPVELPEDEVEEDTQRRVYSYVAAVVGVIGAAASLFVGWMLPLSIAAIVFGVLGLRREEHGRVPAFVGIGTGLAGLVFSAVWVGYYAIVFGALPR